METQRLADAYLLADGDRATLLVGAEDAAHQEVTTAVLGLVLVDDEAREQAANGQCPLALRQCGHCLAEPLERGLAGKLVNDIAFRARDHGLAAERRAALRDDRLDGDAGEGDADGAPLVDLDRRARAPGRPAARRPSQSPRPAGRPDTRG